MGSGRLWRVTAAHALLVLAVAPPAAARTAGVRLAGISFEPHTVEISVGDTVRWVYADETGRNHTVTSQSGEVVSFDSHPNCTSLLQLDCFSPGDDPFVFTFEREGTYTVDYYCKIFGSRSIDPDDADCGMCGKVRVVVAPSPSPSPTGAGATEPPEEEDSGEEPLAPLVGPTATGTGSPGAAAGAGAGELAGGPGPGGGGSGGRIGLAVLFLLVLGTAARTIHRRFLIDPFATPTKGAPRDPRNPLF